MVWYRRRPRMTRLRPSVDYVPPESKQSVVVDESIDEWEAMSEHEVKFCSSQRNPSREIVIVDAEPFLKEAEEMRTRITSVDCLPLVTLEGTRAVDLDKDEERPYRMWYPTASPKKIIYEVTHVTKLEEDTLSKARETINSLKWEKVLPERNVVAEVKMRDKRLRPEIVFGPTMKRRLHEYLRKNHKICRNGSYQLDDLDCFARAEISNSDSDPLRQCSVYYPDVNYERESSALREELMSKLKNIRQHSSNNTRQMSSCTHKMEVAVPSTSYAVSVGDGGLSEILWGEKTHSILINVAESQDVKEYVKWFFPSAIHAVRLSTSERKLLSKYLNANKGEEYKNAVRVCFNSWQECEKALRSNHHNDHRIARLFPRAFIIGRADYGCTTNTTLVYRAKWFPSPSKNKGTVHLKDSRDQSLASRIIFRHGLFCELKYENDPDNTMVVVRCLPSSFQHDCCFVKYIRKVLEENDVAVQRAYLCRSELRKNDLYERVRNIISKTIVEHLIRIRQWHRRYPIDVQDWRELLSGNLPWSWHSLRKTEDPDDAGETFWEADLCFTDVGLGLSLMELLTLDERELRISNGFDPPQRIVMSPIYCIAVAVTKEVRVACDSFIRHLNKEASELNEESGHSHNFLRIVDKTWTAEHEDVDDCDTSEGEISVQGWPREYVEEIATRLLSYFEGFYIDCSDDTRGRLLHGFGAKYVEKLRTTYRGEVVIDVDLLRERIVLVGEKADLVRRYLENFAMNRYGFSITERIAIMPPRYLHNMRNALQYVGKDKLKDICGGALVTLCDDWHIDFHGTVQQYEMLTNFLEDLDQKLLTSSRSLNAASKPDCPVCLLPVDNAFYCMQCGHYYCFKCLIFQLNTQIKNRDFPLQCLHPDCMKLISVGDLKRLLLGDSRLPWLNAKKLQPFIDSSIDFILRKDTSLLRCPTPNCFGIYNRSDVAEGKSIYCQSCNRWRCSSCMMEPHEGVSCAVYSKLRSDEAASLQAYLSSKRGTVRECPTKGCGALIEKEEGCNHMQCTVCGIHFCWICRFMEKTQSKVYGHLRDVHGAIGHEWPVYDNPFDDHDNREALIEALPFLPDDDQDHLMALTFN